MSLDTKMQLHLQAGLPCGESNALEMVLGRACVMLLGKALLPELPEEKQDHAGQPGWGFLGDELHSEVLLVDDMMEVGLEAVLYPSGQDPSGHDSQSPWDRGLGRQGAAMVVVAVLYPFPQSSWDRRLGHESAGMVVVENVGEEELPGAEVISFRLIRFRP